MSMDKNTLIEVLRGMSARMEKEKEYLTELDNAIADGDHGINMTRGFAAVCEKLPSVCDKDIGSILKTVGMTVVSAVGGSAGPLYGTAFLKSGIVLSGKEEISAKDFLLCMRAAIDGIMERGKATKGEKTMLDAMIPALEAMEKAESDGDTPAQMMKKGIAAAWDGVEYTATIAATKGRASYIGERSIGHKDPGAVSFTCLLEEAAQAVQQ